MVAVLVLVYGRQYNVGALPETGSLRFGLPLLIVASMTCDVRWPQWRAFAAATFVALGVSAVWALEAFLYSIVVFAAAAAIRAWLLAPGQRRPWLLRQAAFAVGACVTAHVVLALITLAITGQLPDWGQYLTYIHSFLLGGQAGAITYGFPRWPPGLAVDAAAFASAAALVLLARRAPSVARREPVVTVALAGSTAYTIALMSYTDNRSLTYLLVYVSLPLVMAAVLWLVLILRAPEAGIAVRRAAGAFSVAVTVADDLRRVAADRRQLLAVGARARVSRRRLERRPAPARAPAADRSSRPRRRAAARPLRARPPGPDRAPDRS